VRERALLFGEDKSLVGVVSAGERAGAAAATGVVLLNAGILHRVGPNRLHVRLARRLAAAGTPAMRFDFSGLGDSRPYRGSLPFAERALADVRHAMDALAAQQGCARFLLVGICSGADAALRAAVRDERVAGAALVEPYTVKRPGFVLFSYRRKLLSPRAWARLVGGRSELWAAARQARAARPPALEPPPSAKEPSPALSLPAPSPAPPDAAPVDQLLPGPEELQAQLRALVARRASILFVYSGDSPAYFNYRTLLAREMKPALRTGQARLEVLRNTDHVFTPLGVQDRLVDLLAAWARDASSAETS
jgi:hypothetical protein